MGRRSSPTHAKAARLKYRYGLTVVQYLAQVQHQQGRCAVCREPAPLEVDHDHGTGATRELLCRACNFGVGLLEANPARIHGLLGYLQRHQHPLMPAPGDARPAYRKSAGPVY